MCMNDEEKWGRRAKYEWHYLKRSGGTSAEDPGRDELIWEKDAKTGRNRPKKERVRVQDESVPMFQLRSMAQTRAAAKALRNALAWVVVLAGYRPTPAEELEHVEHRPQTHSAPVANVPVETVVEQEEAERLFPDPPAPAVGDDATVLVGKIEARWDIVKAPARVRMRQWEEHVGAVEFLSPKADPAALQALYAALGGK
jgi:hypothetical protein